MQKNWREKLLLLLITLNILSTGCMDLEVISQEPINDDKHEEEIQVAIASEKPKIIKELFAQDDKKALEKLSQITQRELTKEEHNLLDLEFYFATYLAEECKSFIRDIKVSYPYSSLNLIIDKELYVYEQNDASPIVKDNLVDERILYENVFLNNRKYAENNNVGESANVSDDFIRNVCSIVTRQINDALKKGDFIDCQYLNSKLNELKIYMLEDSSRSYYVSHLGVLFVASDMINDPSTNNAVYEFLQSASMTELKNEFYLERRGYCYETSKIELNFLNWKWFVDACAESLTDNYRQKISTSVNPAYMCLENLKYITLKNNMELEMSTFSHNQSLLFEFFGIDDISMQQELLNMFYAYTPIYNSNPAEEADIFYNYLLKEFGIPWEYQTRMTISSSLNSSAIITQSKIFYSNLIDKIKTRKASLKEIFSLISIYESEINRQLSYENNEFYANNFFEEYVKIQQSFFKYLSIHTFTSMADLNELYCLYNNDYNLTNVNISWLDKETNNYIRYMHQSRLIYKTNPIMKTYSWNYHDTLKK